MELKLIPIKDLKFADYNPRKISKENFARLRESIKNFGFTVPATVNMHPGREMVLIAGHMRTRAAQAEGLTEVPCLVVDLPLQKEKMLNIVLNNKNVQGEFDEEKLAEIIVKLNEEDADIKLTGFDDRQVSVLLDDYMDTGNEEAEEDLEPTEGPTDSVVGEVYQLGPHRLLCGDSTNPEHLKKLMDGKKADLILTDPPYNVNYEGKTDDALKIKNDKMSDEDFISFLTISFKNINEYLRPGGVFYIWYANLQSLNFLTAIKNVGWLVRQFLIWNKHAMVLGRQDYQWKHEPCLYGWKEGAGHTWNGDRSQTTILNFVRPSRSADHPTMKPLSLLEYQIQNSSNRGEIVVDLFAGSGSTLIASDKLERVAYVIELDPKYCDVIRRRYKAYVESKQQQ